MPKPYLIFDAGGTLVFPDFQYLAELARSMGVNVTQEQLFSIHCDLIYELDFQTHQQKYLFDPFPQGYADTLFKTLIKDPLQRVKINKIVKERDRDKALWTATFPWVADSLQKLKTAGFSMSVVSNSDGRASQILQDLNLKLFFDQIFDSEIIGFSKPDVRLFEHALKALDIQAADAIYIGDVYYIDVWGSNQAGMGCIHLDPRKLYQNWPGVHIPSIGDLVELANSLCENPAEYDLFPARDILISY